MLDFYDLMNVTLRGDGIQVFDTRWDEVLLSINDTPQNQILERMFPIEDTAVRAVGNCMRFVRARR